MKWIGTTALACFLFVTGAMSVGAALPGEGQISYVAWGERNRHIYLLDIGREVVVHLTGGTSNQYDPAWSADGTHIAFVSDQDGNREIYTRRVGCPTLFDVCYADVQRLTYNLLADHSPSWSPDGKQVVYVVEWFQAAEIVAASADGSSMRVLTHNQAMDGDPSWSPDGKQIVFASDRKEAWNSNLFIMDADGKNTHSLFVAPSNQLRPFWSPDGSHILFSTGSTNGYDLTLLDLDQADPPIVLLDGLEHSDDAAWSPDGRAIALVSSKDGSPDIYIVRLDCFQPDGTDNACAYRLTNNHTLELSPRWRP